MSVVFNTNRILGSAEDNRMFEGRCFRKHTNNDNNSNALHLLPDVHLFPWFNLIDPIIDGTKFADNKMRLRYQVSDGDNLLGCYKIKQNAWNLEVTFS